MSKAGKRLIKAMNEAVEIIEGRAKPASYRVHVFDDIDVKAIRNKMGLSQTKFAAKFGFALDTLKKWEQRTRRPNGAALVLLRVIDKAPEAVEAALDAA